MQHTYRTRSARLAAALCALALAAAIPVVAAPAAQSATEYSESSSNLLLDLTNEYRTSKGLKTLAWNAGASSVAQKWSETMLAERKMYHNPDVFSQIPSGWTGAAENVGYACGYSSASSAAKAIMSAWKKSAGHDANLRGSYTDIGIGFAWDSSTRCAFTTQDFAKYAQPFDRTVRPVIRGTLTAGETLTVSTGAWSPTPTRFYYRWYRDGEFITGATGKTYKLTSADLGHDIKVSVRGKRSGWITARRSSLTIAVPEAFSSAPAPVIRGSRSVGTTLRATTYGWSPTPERFKYQWYRNDKRITGATTPYYTVVSSDRGDLIRVRVQARKTGYFSTTTTSSNTRIK